MKHVAVLVFFCAAVLSSAQTPCQPVRRALVIGINTYEKGSGRKPGLAIAHPIVPRIPVLGSGDRPSFLDLYGAVSDATKFAALLQSQYGFAPADVDLLIEEKATAQNILDKFQTELIDASSCPGDVSVFFYSGHGSEIRNIARPADSTDAFDQTLVPYDAADGVADIRDKELTRLYVQAAKKGIWLTVIADSCHSGGLSRGLATLARGKDAPKDPRYVKDQGIQADPTRKQPGIVHPVLVMTAAFEKEEAKEDPSGDTPQGAFTEALLMKLRDWPENAPIGNVFHDVQAAVTGRFPGQHPQMFGEGRADLDIFGRQANSTAGMVVRFRQINPDGTYVLDHGTVSGIYEGCVLKLESRPADGLKLRVVRARLGESDAEVAAGSTASLVPGDRFTLDKWVVPQDNALTVYFEKNGPLLDQLTASAQALARVESAAVKVIRDPTVETPAFEIGWLNGNWRVLVGPSSVGRSLGKVLDSGTLIRLIGTGKSVFVNFPLPAGEKLDIGEGTTYDAVRVQKKPQGPDYELVGQCTGKDFIYAWVRPGAIAEDQKEMNLPLHTDWLLPSSKTFAEDLGDMALKLNRIKGWMTLTGVPGGSDEEGEFPYKLTIRKVGSGEVLRDKESHTKKGEEYKVWLTATPAEIANATKSGDIPQRWVYVLAIDRDGDIDVVIPPGTGNEGNHVPQPGTAPAQFQLTSLDHDFSIDDPYGLDTYILLISQDPIDPAVLPAKGVVARSAKRGNTSPLANVLSNIGAATRGPEKPTPVPTTWSVQKLTVRSSEE